MEAITASARQQVTTPAHPDVSGRVITGPGVLPPPMGPMIIDVTPKERAAISNVANILMRAFSHYEHPDYIPALHLNAFQLLPERIAGLLSRFGTDFSRNQYGALVLRGLTEVDQDALGPTPPSWKETDYSKLIKFGFICSLLHGAISLPNRYSITPNEKAVASCIAPIPDEKMSHTQTGSGSRTDIFVFIRKMPFLFNQADFLHFPFPAQ